MCKTHRSLLFCLVTLAIVTTGCGSSGSDPRENHLKGNVSFNGAPVIAGDIQFIPAQGNSGPPGSATIVDGAFDTAAPGGKGTIGGPHTVIINGFDGKAQPEAELPQGQPLFKDYKVDFDVPKGGEATQDFNVTPQGGGV